MSETVDDGVGSPLSADKISKIRSDLDVVRNNMTVFSEMLTELNPSGGGNPADLELLLELYKTCKEMQSRVGQLLCTPTTDELTVDMLQINDDMNDLFDRYDRKTAAYNKAKGLPAFSPGVGGAPGDAPLIDLGEDLGAMNLQSQNTTTTTATTKSSSGGGGGDADFDQFVSSRSNPSAKKSTSSNLGFGLGQPQELTEEQLISGHRETDFEEMEEWLRANPGSEASLTSIPVQMENYLAQRARVTGELPSSSSMDKPS